jgi:hypothetical protein
MFLTSRKTVVSFSIIFTTLAACTKKAQESISDSSNTKASELENTIAAKSQEFRENTSDTIDSAANTATEMKEELASAGNNATETVKKNAAKAIDSAKDTVETMKASAVDSAESTLNSAQESISEVASPIIEKAESIQKKVLEKKKENNRIEKKPSQKKLIQKSYSAFKSCRVITGNLNVRNKPNRNSKIVGRLKSGQTLRAKPAQANWMKVTLGTGAQGFAMQGKGLMNCNSDSFANKKVKNKN